MPLPVFMILRVVLFFVATPVVFNALQAIDVSKVFRANSTNHIRILMMVVSIILGYFFADVLVSLVEHVSGLF